MTSIIHQSYVPSNSTIDTVNKVLAKHAGERMTAQGFFSIHANAFKLSTAPRKINGTFSSLADLIAWEVDTGLVDFEYNLTGTSYYTIKGVKPEAQSEAVHNPRCKEGTTHKMAQKLFTLREFMPNLAHLECAEHQLNEGKVFKKGEWLTEDQYNVQYSQAKPDAWEISGNDIIYADERSTFKELHAQQIEIVEQMKKIRGPIKFSVKCDDRGRFYLLGGITSPHNGRFARWLYTQPDEVTLDHRTSFAQIIAIILGDNVLGDTVGVTNDTASDFYVSALKAFGVIIERNSYEREACKSAIMPASYGAGEELAKARFDAVFARAKARGETVTPERQAQVWDACAKVLHVFDALRKKTQNFAKWCADDGETPAWVTPSGFIAKKDYFCKRKVVVTLTTDDEDTAYFPKSMTLDASTKIICTQSIPSSETTAGQKSVITATMANLIQSMDASIMAKTAVKFYEKTGEILYPIHDSYTVKKENASTLINCVCEVLREIAVSPEVAQIRKDLHLPAVSLKSENSGHVRGRVLDMQHMMPLEQED